MSHFSHSFIRLRIHSGFKTAYNFYHSSGGRRVFPFTYAHYLKIERGGSLPQPSALAIMLNLIRRVLPPEDREELVRAYLRDLSGTAAVYEELFAPLLAATGERAHENALPPVLGRLTVNLTPAQFRTIVSSPAATGCFMLFANVPSAFSIEKIAELIGSSKGECLAAVKALRSRRLVVARGPDRYAFAISAEQRYTLPSSQGCDPLYDKLLKNIDRLAGKRGSPLYGHMATIRLSPSALDRVIRDFNETFNMCSGLNQKLMPPGPETPLYFIEARVRRGVVFPPAADAVLAETAARLGQARRPEKIRKGRRRGP